MASLPASQSSLRRFWPFGVWLAVFYPTWLCIVSFGHYWSEVPAHWPIAVAMAAGSYFAGSTPIGGGSVGFPVLVLLFHLPASLGRNFALAVQSIGMVSASIFILSARRPIDWHLLKPALIGSTIGTPLGAVLIAPFAPDLWVKLLFAVTWTSFGIMHFAKLNTLITAKGLAEPWEGVDLSLGLWIGIVGGIAASLTGVAIDMVIYAVLVLIYRADLKIAIPTSVILMAYTSVIGIGTNVALSHLSPARYSVSPEVFYNWLSAAPVVALGAPFGALVVERLPRRPTLILVSVLSVGQFVWTVVEERVGGWTLVLAIAAVLFANLLFHYMYLLGDRRPIKAPTDAAGADRITPLAGSDYI